MRARRRELTEEDSITSLEPLKEPFMSRRSRRGIVALLVMATWLAFSVPAATAQSDADFKHIQLAVQRAGAFEKQGELAQAAQEYARALDLARRAFGFEDPLSAACMINLA